MGFTSALEATNVPAMTYINWNPVAQVPASLSNDHSTVAEVVVTGPAVHLSAWNQNGDSSDTRMTPDEARELAMALLTAAAQVPALRLVA